MFFVRIFCLIITIMLKKTDNLQNISFQVVFIQSFYSLEISAQLNLKINFQSLTVAYLDETFCRKKDE